MKKITLIIVAFILITSSNAQNNSVSKDLSYKTISTLKYIPLSKVRFAEIESAMEKQATWTPIDLKGFSKKELVTFYMQSYNDKIISTWVDFAYKKMKKFNLIKENSEEDKNFNKLIKLPRNFDNAFRFMMLMTKEQVETVGY